MPEQMMMIGPKHDRRSFLQGAAAVAGLSWGRLNHLPFLAANTSTRITEVFLDLNNIYKWDNSNGDTWDPFWADDDNLYAFNCDGRGFGSSPRNLAFNRLAGDTCPSLNGSAVNSMDEYGVGSQKGPDGATWKACGQECIDGVFYAFVSRNTYGSDSHDPLLRQTAVNSSLIRSTDRGATWKRTAAENYRDPMWAGPAFGAPFFVHYGKNGGRVARDGADQYVYATSTNGFWNDGDYYILGRVERKRLSDLDRGDWSYYSGGNGAQASKWSPHIEDARPILSSPAHCGQGPVCYVAALQRYLMVAWYNTALMTKWFEPNRMRYDFYQAEHPWGPWELVGSHSDNFISSGHMYGPSLCARFQERKGPEVQISMFTSGCPFEDAPSGLYKMWEIPLILRTRPIRAAQIIPGDDPRIAYAGQWSGRDRKATSGHPHTRYTNSPGSRARLSFKGSGIEYLTEKGPDCGEVEIHLDGKPQTTASLLTKTFPRTTSVQAFAVGRLSAGSHTIELVTRDSSYVAVEAFQVTE